MVAGQYAKLPKLKDHRILALDIGTRFIKAAELRLNRGVISLLNVVVCPTPPDTLDKSQILDPMLLGQSIRQLLTANKITTRQTVVAIRGQSSVVVRPIELPKMSKKELAETMKFEVERHVPFAANEVVMDYAPLVDPEELPETEENMKVLLAVAQEELVKSYLKVLQAAKLTPVAFDVEILSTIRALVDIHEQDGGREQTVALVNIGASSTDISIVHQGNLVFNRSVPIAGDAFTNAVAEQMGRAFEEAEELKVQHALVFLDPAVGELPAPHMDGAAPAGNAGEAAAPFFTAFDEAGQEATVAWESNGPLPQQVFSLDENFDTEGSLTFGAAAPPPEPEQPAAPMPFTFTDDDQDEAQANSPFFNLADEPEDIPAPPPAPDAPAQSPGPVFDLSSELEEQLPPQRPRPSQTDEPEVEMPLAAAPKVEPASEPTVNEAVPVTETDIPSSMTSPEPALGMDLPWQTTAASVPKDEMFQRRIFEAMLPTLGELVTEIQRSLEFYSSREPNHAISRIYLYGGASRMPRLAEFIHQEVGVEVLPANPFESIETTPCQLPAEYLQDLAPALPVCIGLGLRDMLA